jgi:hypothetical protein
MEFVNSDVAEEYNRWIGLIADENHNFNLLIA